MNCTVSNFHEYDMMYSNVDTYLKKEPKNLFSDNARKGWSQQSTRQGCLKEASDEKVHIGHCPGEQRVPRRKVNILDLEKIQKHPTCTLWREALHLSGPSPGFHSL